MNRLPKLQELLDKAAFLKNNSHAIPDLWMRAWDDFSNHFNRLQEQVGIMQGILKDMNLDIGEIPRLDETLEKMAQICHKFQDQYQKDAPVFQTLLETLDCSEDLATAINFVYDLDTSMSGDRVYSVQRDKLYYGDLENLGNFIINLHSFFSLPGASSPPPKKASINKHLAALRVLGGHLLDELIPGVMYRRIPELVVEIDDIVAKINNILEPARIIIDHNFFEKEIKKARECLSILVVSEEIKEQKPIKLKGILGTKGKAKDLVDLLSALPFG